MILLTDTDGKLILINPEYLVGAHQVGKDKTEINMVGDLVYTVQGTAEDIHDAWTGVEGVYPEETEDCYTCYYAEEGDAVPGQLICEMCEDHDHWEPADDSDDATTAVPGDTGGEVDSEVHVSGVPYAVPLSAVKGGGHD